MRATFKLINSYFWKTFYGPVLAFVFPVILLAIFGQIFKIEYIYPGIIAMALMFIGIILLPLSIMELKQSSLFKYIGSTDVNPLRFSFVVVLFYVFISAVTSVIVFAFTVVFWFDKVFPSEGFSTGILGGIFGSFVGATGFYFSCFIHLVFVILTGVTISVLSKTTQQALSIAVVIIMPSMFLSGMIISIDVIANYPVLNWMSRLIPYRYSVGNMIIASTPLDQIGDFFASLNSQEKEILFGDENIIEGEVYLFYEGEMQPNPVSSIDDLIDFVDEYGYEALLANTDDDVLFDYVFGVAIAENSAKSDNNIFNITSSWSTRKITTIDEFKEFLYVYFDREGDLEPLVETVLEPILEGELEWVKLFSKKTNVVYTITDRVLNFVVPVLISLLMGVFITKKFTWTSR